MNLSSGQRLHFISCWDQRPSHFLTEKMSTSHAQPPPHPWSKPTERSPRIRILFRVRHKAPRGPVPAWLPDQEAGLQERRCWAVFCRPGVQVRVGTELGGAERG